MHVLKKENLLDGTGVDHLVPWTKVTKWPNPKEKTYQDLIKDKTDMIDNANGENYMSLVANVFLPCIGPPVYPVNFTTIFYIKET